VAIWRLACRFRVSHPRHEPHRSPIPGILGVFVDDPNDAFPAEAERRRAETALHLCWPFTLQGQHEQINEGQFRRRMPVQQLDDVGKSRGDITRNPDLLGDMSLFVQPFKKRFHTDMYGGGDWISAE
jgi:hypothetical protein